MRDDVGVRECVCACGRVDALAQRPATAVSTVFVALLVTLIDGDLGLDLVFFVTQLLSIVLHSRFGG